MKCERIYMAKRVNGTQVGREERKNIGIKRRRNFTSRVR
jgi:hypothetical protein